MRVGARAFVAIFVSLVTAGSAIPAHGQELPSIQSWTMWDARTFEGHRATSSDAMVRPHVPAAPDLSPPLPDAPVVLADDITLPDAPVPESGGADAVFAWLYWRAKALEADGQEARAQLIFEAVGPHVAHVGGELPRRAKKVKAEAPVIEEPPPKTFLDRWLDVARSDYRAKRNAAAEKGLRKIVARKKLAPALRCEANYLLGRVLERLRKKKDSGPFYRAAAASCSTDVATAEPALASIRTEALYRAGLAELGRDTKAATGHFETLLAEKPDSRYADDALYFMIGVAKAQKDDERVVELEKRLFDHYESADMTRSYVWEPIYDHLLAKRWAEAEALLNEAVKLSPDPTYYGQGRFSYYLGLAQYEQERPAEAVATWRQTFQRHPTAFYGHLALQSLYAHDPDVDAWLAATARPREAAPVVFDLASPEVRGWVALGDYGRAASHILDAEGDKSDHDLWLAAFLAHQAGDYTLSHNIARRRIPGFPQTYGLPDAHTRLLFEIAYPDPYARLVEYWADKNDTDRFLVRAIMREESGFNPKVVSWAGAVGLMQLMLPTAKGNAEDVPGVKITPSALKLPENNLPISTHLLAWLGERYDDHPVLMAAAYNAGAGAASKWLKRRAGWQTGLFTEAMNYTQARNYSRRVVGSHLIYQWLWSDEPPRKWADTVRP